MTEKRKAAVLEASTRPVKRDKRSSTDDEEMGQSKKDSHSDLLDLLDLTTSDTDEIQARFDSIASKLLSGDFHLVIRNKPGSEISYQLLEIEFYLWKDGCHEDPFTHGSEEQRISGRWYFHRAPKKSHDSSRSSTSASGYRGGTRKGLDLTIGAPTTVSSPYFSASGSDIKPDVRGGILLRSMKRVDADSEKIISGPSLLVDEVLKQHSCSGITELVKDIWKDDIAAFNPRSSMFLRAVSEPSTPPTVYTSPRIGLDLSHPGIPSTNTHAHPRVIFLNRRFRYFTHPAKLTANGRVQTFLGALDAVQKSEKDDLKAKISTMMGLKPPSVQNYLDYYKDGYVSGELKGFLGASGKGASSSPAKYLRMMGAIAKALGRG